MLKREHLSDKIVDIIGKQILRNELKSGEIIIETQISKEWGVSRSPVRDALRTLEKQRLVERVPRGSYKVFELTAEYITSFYDVLMIFYGYAIPRAVRKMTGENRRRLQSIDEKIKTSIENDELSEYVKNICHLGQTILKLAENPILAQISIDVLPTAKRILHKAVARSACPLTIADHSIRPVCNFILRGEQEAAVEAFNEFVHSTRSLLLASE